jgi:hypothetical protein
MIEKMNEKEPLGRRKEPRYKTADERSLNCDCFHEEDEPKRGSVIDMSTHGLRFLCEGNFRSGQVVLIELQSDESLGAFGGIIRAVNPWVGGRTVYGCELVEPLTSDVLNVLAEQGVVNRRTEQRVQWNQPAKMSWELRPGEVDIEIQDCSLGGLMITSPIAIPENVNLRIRLDANQDDEVVMTAKTAWHVEKDDHCIAGLAFNHRQIPKAMKQILSQADGGKNLSEKSERASSIRPSLMIVAAMVLLGVTLLQTGLLQ